MTFCKSRVRSNLHVPWLNPFCVYEFIINKTYKKVRYIFKTYNIFYSLIDFTSSNFIPKIIVSKKDVGIYFAPWGNSPFPGQDNGDSCI